MPRGHRRSEPRRRATSSRARVPRRRDLGGLAPRAARRSLKSRASHPGARRRQTVDVAGKQRCETENAGPDGRVRRGVVHSPAGARAHRSPDEPRGSPPTPYQRKQTPSCVRVGSTGTLRGDEWRGGAVARATKPQTLKIRRRVRTSRSGHVSPELDRVLTGPPVRVVPRQNVTLIQPRLLGIFDSRRTVNRFDFMARQYVT